jgi:hypothetical protein
LLPFCAILSSHAAVSEVALAAHWSFLSQALIIFDEKGAQLFPALPSEYLNQWCWYDQVLSYMTKQTRRKSFKSPLSIFSAISIFSPHRII